MSLFTDSDFVTSTSLSAIDGELSKNVIGNAQLGVTLEGPNSVIRRTIEEAGALILAKFQSYSGYLIGGGTSAHYLAVNATGGNNAINRPRIRLAQVVAIDPDPSRVHLRRWLEYRCLAATFRAVFRRNTAKDQDRYAVKVNDYDQEAKSAAAALWSVGLPVITIGGPLDCPGAIRQAYAGAFTANAVTHGGAGSTDTGGPWYCAITYTGALYVSPTVKGNAESGPSATQLVTTANGERITLSIAALTPPDGTMLTGNADGIYVRMAATGWNVYVGATADTMRLQNAAPIALTSTTYTLTDAPTATGARMTSGQFSTSSYASSNIVARG
ncbi:MAG: hypothetical protein NVS9B4_00810 [Candidatus Acidiferrum sp.]